MTGTHQQPRGYSLIILPDCHDFSGIIVSVAIIDVMGNVSGMEISAVISHGDRRGIEILEQFKIGFSRYTCVLSYCFSRVRYTR